MQHNLAVVNECPNRCSRILFLDFIQRSWWNAGSTGGAFTWVEESRAYG